MRFSPDPKPHLNDKWQVDLLVLQPGSAGEQLWGVRPLQDLLGVGNLCAEGEVGLPRRAQSQPVPSERMAHWHMAANKSSRAVTALLLDVSADLERERTDRIGVLRGGVRRELYLDRSRGIVPTTRAAWSGSDLGILTTELKVAAFLAEVHRGLLAGDGAVALWMSASQNPYGRSALILALTGKVDAKGREDLRASDAADLFAKKVSLAITH